MSSSNFIDYVKLNFRSGNGGAGSAHLHRDKMTSKGGPDGGDGGRGGHIILRGSKNLWTLLPYKFRKHIKAGHGGNGGQSTSTGANGGDIILDVPLGVVVRNSETHEIEQEITEEGQTYVALNGGQGGKGNSHFKNSVRQTPRFAQPGMPGEEIWIILELKVLADVGLVGFPNVGKSTLLSAITAAKPKIADYEFTTLTPNLGIVAYRDDQSFIMADIPGIIENAHQGKGIGLRFLRHIERNSVLLFMIPADSKDIIEDYKVLLNELKMHNRELMDKERLLAITKDDLLDDELREEIEKELPDISYVFISSVAQTGLLALKDKIWTAIHR
ncbi:MAG: GTP-binding protein [Patiriisocius sp.]|jgi:GTP-binding protein